VVRSFCSLADGLRIVFGVNIYTFPMMSRIAFRFMATPSGPPLSARSTYSINVAFRRQYAAAFLCAVS
jgi:hypothetical protein